MNELPKGWTWKKLGEVLNFIGGGTPDKSNKSFWNGDIPWASVKDIKDKYLTMTQDFISENGLNNSSSQLALPGELILITRISPGKTSISKIKAAINQDLKIVKPKILVDTVFIHYLFETIEKEIIKKSSGTTVLGIRLEILKDIAIPLPPLPVQRAIVTKIEEIFSELDHGVAQLKAAQQQLKVYRQAVLKWAFEGKLTGGNAVEGELVEGWKWVRLNEICKIVGGVTKGKDFKGRETIWLPYLRVANVQDGYLDLTEIKTIEVLPSDKEKYKLHHGDILYTEGGDKDKLGRGTIWKNEIEDCIHQNHIFRARPLSREFESKFIAYYSQTKAAKNYFFKHGKQTTNLASINLTILSNLPLPLPPLPVQHLIVAEIERRLEGCAQMEAAIGRGLAQAEVLRQGVLKRAFAGGLVV